MTRTRIALAGMALIGVVGCNESTTGGPGATNPSGTQNQTANKPVVNDSRETFSLRMPVTSTSIKQGETKSASIAINRGTNFDDDVQVTFSSLPTGITLDQTNPTLAKSDQELKLNITAADDAPVGDFAIKVSGHPKKGGADATGEFKISVSAK